MKFNGGQDKSYALVDSGSQISIMSRGLPTFLGLIEPEEANVLEKGFHISGFNNVTQFCPLMRTQLQFGRKANKTVEAYLCLVPLQEYKFILGHDFLLPLGYVLNSQKGTLTLGAAVNDNDRPLRLELISKDRVMSSAVMSKFKEWYAQQSSRVGDSVHP